MTNQAAAFSFAEQNARIMQSNCGREEGMGEAAFRTMFSGACHSVCQQPGGFFPGKRGGYPGPAPRQLCMSNMEQFGRPRCLAFAPCSAQQSPAQAKGCWASREGKGWIVRLRCFPRAAPDAAKVEQDTGVP